MDFSANPAGIPPLGFTHGGYFHADDVFSAALLTLLRPDIRIYRGFEVPKGFSGIAFDIGGGPFDHHTPPLVRRENGVAYAAFGLLWREYGRFFLSEAEAKRFDEKFVQPLDMDDNVGTGNFLAGLMGAFNPVWDSQQSPDDAFSEAVDAAKKILENKLKNLAAVERAAPLVEKYLKSIKDGVVVMEKYIPWKPVLVPSAAEFVIFPSLRGGYSVQCVPSDFAAKSPNKVSLPLAWRGKEGQALAEITGVAGALFCHASGFMVTAGTREDARTLCRLAKADFEKRQEQSRADKARSSQQEKQ